MLLTSYQQYQDSKLNTTAHELDSAIQLNKNLLYSVIKTLPIELSTYDYQRDAEIKHLFSLLAVLSSHGFDVYHLQDISCNSLLEEKNQLAEFLNSYISNLYAEKMTKLEDLLIINASYMDSTSQQLNKFLVSCGYQHDFFCRKDEHYPVWNSCDFFKLSFEEICRYYFDAKKEYYEHLLPILEYSTLLVIEDIGEENCLQMQTRPSVSLLKTILDNRKQQNRRTILTTNRPLAKNHPPTLEKTYSLKEIYGQRFFDTFLKQHGRLVDVALLNFETNYLNQMPLLEEHLSYIKDNDPSFVEKFFKQNETSNETKDKPINEEANNETENDEWDSI